MKVGASVRTICEHCQVIIRSAKIGNDGSRKKVRRVKCARNPRHNQRQG